MARFPRTEAEIAELASTIVEGLEAGADDFPRPPVGAAALEALLEEYRGALVEVTQADAAARERRVQKRRDLKELTAAMKAVLKYAEIVARKEPEKLVQFGWGPPRDPRALTPPGEVRMFRTLAANLTRTPTVLTHPGRGRHVDRPHMEGAARRWRAGRVRHRTPRRAEGGVEGSEDDHRDRAPPG